MKKMKRFLSIYMIVVMIACIIPLVKPLEIRAESQTFRKGDIITFGKYPQSVVTDSALITTLKNSIVSWTYYPYYVSGSRKDFMKYTDVTTANGVSYRGVYFTQYRPYWNKNPSSYNEQSSNGYLTNTIYWFKYEPLSWTVLDNSGLVVCNKIIDSSYFNTSSNSSWYNSYAEYWLNSNFFETAFNDIEKQAVLYSNISTNSIDTIDKVFLLSYDDVINPDYGFNSSYSYADSFRAKVGTDYSFCQGLWQNNKYGDWWLRTAKNSSSVRIVNWNGDVTIGNNVTEASVTSCGYVPAMRLDIEKLNSTQHLPTDPAPPTHTHAYKRVVVPATITKAGYAYKQCTICGKKGKTVTIAKISTVKLAKTSYVYTGKARTPTVVIKDSKGNALKKNTDYKVKYASGRTECGKYAVKVVFMGNYAGKKTLKFNIKLGKVTGITQKDTKGIYLTWNKVTGATRYEVWVYKEGYSKPKCVKSSTERWIENTKIEAGRTMKMQIRAVRVLPDGSETYSTVIYTATAK